MWMFDPTSAYPQYSDTQIATMLGLIPNWLNPLDGRPILDQLEEGYSFWHTPNATNHHDIPPDEREGDGSALLKDGTFIYPDDPPLKPLAKFTSRNGDVFYQYPYAMYTVLPKGLSPVWGRMD